jgi:hypothetical protein
VAAGIYKPAIQHSRFLQCSGGRVACRVKTIALKQSAATSYPSPQIETPQQPPST